MPQDAPFRRKQKQRRTIKLAKWRAKQDAKAETTTSAAKPEAKK
jgi:hypothetical protein